MFFFKHVSLQSFHNNKRPQTSKYRKHNDPEKLQDSYATNMSGKNLKSSVKNFFHNSSTSTVGGLKVKDGEFQNKGKSYAKLDNSHFDETSHEQMFHIQQS